jgi:putative transposase
MDQFQFFDPKQEFSVTFKALPHWTQAGTITFITWRTADSLPKSALDRLAGERLELLSRFGLDPTGDWKRQLARLQPLVRGRIQWKLFTVWDELLDNGAGACVLARPELSKIVEESLLHFDGERYVITDSVVMPNHVHLLAAFRDDESLIKQCTSWKRYTARQIQAILGLQGEFWQVEQFDHLVRSPEQFDHYRRYIADNARQASLPIGSFRHYAKILK